MWISLKYEPELDSLLCFVALAQTWIVVVWYGEGLATPDYGGGRKLDISVRFLIALQQLLVYKDYDYDEVALFTNLA